MKYFINEKEYTCVVYIDANTITTLCDIADSIDDVFPQTVIEVTHNRNAKQGSIIFKKESPELIDKIKEILDTNDNQQSDIDFLLNDMN